MSIALINPAQETLPLTVQQVYWLIDGQRFLAHLADLPTIRLVARCRVCLSAHATPTVTDGRPKTLVRCDCRAGEVKGDVPIDVAPLLLSLGWELACALCGQTVAGENAARDTRLTVRCGCTTREYLVPVA